MSIFFKYMRYEMTPSSALYCILFEKYFIWPSNTVYSYARNNQICDAIQSIITDTKTEVIIQNYALYCYTLYII